MKPANCSLSQGYNARPWYYFRFGLKLRNGGRGHEGLDYACKSGTPVKAAHAGTIRHSGWLGNYGNYIGLQADRGYGTGYAHLLRTAVKVGQKVKEGQVIGYSGNTGNSSAPHLHFNYYRNYGIWVYDNPEELLNRGTEETYMGIPTKTYARELARAWILEITGNRHPDADIDKNHAGKRRVEIEASFFDKYPNEWRRAANYLYDKAHGPTSGADKVKRDKDIEAHRKKHTTYAALEAKLLDAVGRG